VGYCHGESPSPALLAALFALASADTEAEKRAAWNQALTLPSDTIAPAEMLEAALRDGLERAAERELAKQALNSSFQKLATVLVQRLGSRKVAGILPVLGAAVGGAVNIRFMYRLGEAASMAFAARRLIADGIAPSGLQLAEPLPKKIRSRQTARAKKATPRRRRRDPAP
jgi:hypothetical protein